MTLRADGGTGDAEDAPVMRRQKTRSANVGGAPTSSGVSRHRAHGGLSHRHLEERLEGALGAYLMRDVLSEALGEDAKPTD
jgi:hypothetical protein